MSIPRRHSLAGTNGIPAMNERVYIEVDLERTDLGPGEHGTRPARIHWPDGRSWKIEGVFSRQDFGREIFGNLVTRYTVGIRRQTKTIYHDKTGWADLRLVVIDLSREGKADGGAAAAGAVTSNAAAADLRKTVERNLRP